MNSRNTSYASTYYSLQNLHSYQFSQSENPHKELKRETERREFFERPNVLQTAAFKKYKQTIYNIQNKLSNQNSHSNRLFTGYEEQKYSTINVKANEELKSYVESVIKEYGCSKLILEKAYKNNYIVSLENLALVIKELVLNIDKKKNLIDEFKKEEKKKDKLIASLEEKLKDTLKVNIDSCQETGQCKKCVHEVKLEEIQKLFNINNSNDIIKGVKENVRSAVELNKFATNIHNLVDRSKKQVVNLKETIQTIKGLVSEREECGKILLLRNKLCKILYNNENISDEQMVYSFIMYRLMMFKNLKHSQ